MRKKNILIIQAVLKNYRVPLFNLLSEKYNLSIISCLNQSDIRHKFQFQLIPYTRIFFFKYCKTLISILKTKRIDVLVVPDHFEWISFLIIGLLPRKFPILWYGFTLSKNNFFYKQIKSRLFKYILNKNKNDQLIFYDYSSSNESIKNIGFSLRSHVANNTVKIRVNEKKSNTKKRDYFVNIGAFDQRKGNLELINTFNSILHEIPDDIKLLFVGDGPEFEKIQFLIKKLGLNSRIILKKGTFNNKVLKNYYSKAIANISLNQAGLSVLQSFANEVPFVTRANAISGGEINNIYHGYNGFLIGKNSNELKKMLIFCSNNKKKMKIMGKNALNTYLSFSSSDSFINNFEYAVDQALSNK